MEENVQRFGDDIIDGDDIVGELKNEINWFRKECQDCRMEKDKLYMKFYEVIEVFRGEFEKFLGEKENLI